MDFKEEIINGIEYIRLNGNLYREGSDGVEIPSDQIPALLYSDLPDGQLINITDEKINLIIFGGADACNVLMKFSENGWQNGNEISSSTFANIIDLMSQIRETSPRILSIENEEYDDSTIYFAAYVRITKEVLPEIYLEVCKMMEDLLKPIRDINASIKEKCAELQQIIDEQQE